MIDPVRISNGIFPVPSAFKVDQGSLTPDEKRAGFAELLNMAIEQIQELSSESDANAINIALGRPVELHQVMLTAAKAQIAMELLIEIRNRLIEAYQEINRMPV